MLLKQNLNQLLRICVGEEGILTSFQQISSERIDK